MIDGDTFDARVRVWPGTDITTRVRLRDIDAAEFKARCAEERRLAQDAYDALSAMLADGGVTITRVSFDKYGGRCWPTPRRGARLISLRHCSMPAWCGAIPADGALGGAERGRALEQRDQAPT